jgi:hypothetical protein
MRFNWWEASLLFTLWAVQFVLSGFERPLDPTLPHNSLAVGLAGWLSVGAERIESLAHTGKEVITALYFIWTGGLIALAFKRRRTFEAFALFPKLMREHW